MWRVPVRDRALFSSSLCRLRRLASVSRLSRLPRSALDVPCPRPESVGLPEFLDCLSCRGRLWTCPVPVQKRSRELRVGGPLPLGGSWFGFNQRILTKCRQILSDHASNWQRIRKLNIGTATRPSLIVRVRDPEDFAAWEEFSAIYRPVIFRFARRQGLQESDAEDLVQSVMLSVATQIGNWQPDGNRARFRTWLLKIARNQTISHLRRRSSIAVARGGSTSVQRLAEVPASEAMIDQDLQRECFRHAASKVRLQFEEVTWQAFWMTAVEERSIHEVAAHLKIGCYEISGVIGCGGMGIVLKAFEPALGRFVAVKVLSPNYWKDSVARERFIREARAAASIVHQGVIEIYGVAETNGIPYFAMPYIRGDSLQKRIDRSGPLAIDEILRIGMQVAGGLAAAHAQGLVHRDVKPANVLLGDGIDRARLSDFGIARFDSDASITSTGYVPGTPQYMSPEQVRGESIDHRSDLFSFGSVLYTMCVGRAPFEAETSFELLNQIVSIDPPKLERLRPDLPIWLVALIDRLHEKDPNDRLQSASETRLLIEQCLARWQQPSTVVLPALASTLEKQYRQKSAEKLNYLSTKGFVMLATLFTLIVGGVVLPFFAPNLLSGLAGEDEKAIGLQGRLIDDEGKPVGNVEV